jgi:hypothetical protein
VQSRLLLPLLLLLLSWLLVWLAVAKPTPGLLLLLPLLPVITLMPCQCIQLNYRQASSSGSCFLPLLPLQTNTAAAAAAAEYHCLPDLFQQISNRRVFRAQPQLG